MSFLLWLLVAIVVLLWLHLVALIPGEVWHALAERIRNPPPSTDVRLLEEYHRHLEAGGTCESCRRADQEGCEGDFL